MKSFSWFRGYGGNYRAFVHSEWSLKGEVKPMHPEEAHYYKVLINTKWVLIYFSDDEAGK